MSKILVKTIVWRVLSFSVAVCTARIWFGDWHITKFTIYISLQMMVVYYIFERVWANDHT